MLEACLMSQAEVLYELSSGADYIIASELETTAHCLHFDSFTSELYQNPYVDPLLYAKSIVETTGNNEYYENQTAVAVDASKLDQFYASINDLASALQRAYNTGDTNTQLEIMRCAEASAWVQRVAPYIDLQSLASRLSADDKITDSAIKKAATNLVTSLSRAIVSKNIMYYDYNKKEYVNTDKLGGVSALFYATSFDRPKRRVWSLFSGMYDLLDFGSNPVWLNFLKSYATFQKAEYGLSKTPSSTLTLSHAGHELSLRVTDASGNKVGPDADNPTLTRIDIKIPGSTYFDYSNGTVVVYLPGDVSDYKVTVDGTNMLEAKENYTLTATRYAGETVSADKALTNTIKAGTRQTTPVTETGNQITFGTTTSEVVTTSTTGGQGSTTSGGGVPGYSGPTILLGFLIALIGLTLLHSRKKHASS